MTDLDHSAQTLGWFEERAERLAAAGRTQFACEVVHTGSAIAVMNHPGAFASHRFDAVLARAAAALGAAPRWRGRGNDPRDVLHVMTHATAQGGHARLAARWMTRDAGRRHSLIVTAPFAQTPTALRAAVDASGGREHTLAPAGPEMLDRARLLREIALGYDAVVLYPDPHDPLPALALGGLTERPPVLAADISDHCFTVGRGVVDLLVCNREQAAQTARERRGVPAARVAVLPLPVELPEQLPDAAAIRRTLGLDPDALLIVTVGASYKYEVVEGPHLLDLVEPVLAERPHVQLVAVGPDHAGRWHEGHEGTAGRVRALGTIEALGLLSAADVVVESYPTGGSTASAEAAALGRPLLGFAPDAAEAALCAAGAVTDRPATPEAFRARLAQLLDDPGARMRAGAQVRAANRLYHDAAAWRDELAALYAHAARVGPIGFEELDHPPRGDTPVSRIAHRLHARAGKLIPASKIDSLQARIDLLDRDPGLGCYISHALGGYPAVPVRFGRALIAPPISPEGLGEAVALLRDVVRSDLAGSAAITIAPDEVDAAVPLLERALAAGPEYDLDVVPAADPRLLLGEPGQLVLHVPGDRLAAA